MDDAHAVAMLFRRTKGMNEAAVFIDLVKERAVMGREGAAIGALFKTRRRIGPGSNPTVL